MVSHEDSKIKIQSRFDIVAFVNEFAKKYQRLFKDDYYKDVLPPSTHMPYFPFEVTLEIKKIEF